MNELTMEQLRIKVSEIVRYKYDKIVQPEMAKRHGKSITRNYRTIIHSNKN